MSTDTYFPHAVCVDCKWIQMFHAGSLRASEDHAQHHEQMTGHTTRIKTHHEFADLLWMEEFIVNAHGDEALGWWLETLPPFVAVLVREYHSGRLSLEVCEERYFCTCNDCTEAQRRSFMAEAQREPF